MDQKIKAEWVKALRSGEYEQGKNALARVKDETTEYCCLGVLCDLAVKAGVNVTVQKGAGGGDRYYYDGNASTLPDSVIKWAGARSENPVLDLGDGEAPAALAELNDGDEDRVPWSFGQIADVIEASL